MADKHKIKQIEGEGITAKVINVGKLYSSYFRFAQAAGYPDAAPDVMISNKSELAREGSTVKVLAKGVHGRQRRRGVLYVVEDRNGERFVYGADGLELSREMDDKELTEIITDTVDKIRRKAYRDGYEQGKFDQRMDTAFDDVSRVVNGDTPRKTGREFIEESRQETPKELPSEIVDKLVQMKRDEIVEQAKEDAEKRFFISGKYGVGKVVNGPHGHNTVEFVINKDKKTVVALLSLAYSEGYTTARGIAKCAPGDVFNEHIGKAIAIRRALGLEVPDEYLNAPQPTEVRVEEADAS